MPARKLVWQASRSACKVSDCMRLSFGQVLLPSLLLGACSFPEYAFIPPLQAGGASGSAGAAGTTSSCEDGVQGENETGIDCGGPCPGCVAYQDCAVDNDCESKHCLKGVCQPASCTDSIKNGAESDTDCGGHCPLCAPDAACTADSDCASGVCASSSCQPPSCIDHVTNGNETGVDCGGKCTACALGMSCQIASDCVSQRCDSTQLLCVAQGCQNLAKDGLETDIDCGGGQCAPCSATERCAQPSDCDSSLCNASTKHCDAPSCMDQVVNQEETDTDCGGPNCPKCTNGHNCRAASDCSSGLCQTKLCVPAAPTGMKLDQTGWIPTASDTFGDSSPKAMLDGDPNARWTSGTEQSAGMWIKIDMRKPQFFFMVTLDTTNWPGDAGKGYKVLVSTDGTFNSEPKLFSGGKAYQELAFENAVVARYIWIQLTLPGTEWWSVGELKVTQ